MDEIKFKRGQVWESADGYLMMVTEIDHTSGIVYFVTELSEYWHFKFDDKYIKALFDPNDQNKNKF